MLYDDLKHYINKEMASFHTPGHKGTKIFDQPIWDLDLTELPETDSLYEASGVLFKAEERVKKLFGSNKSLISSGGNTLCIQTMIRLASLDKKPIIAGRNIHRSAVGAMALLGIQPEWVVPEYDKDINLPGGINPENITNRLDKIGIPSAVYITSPNYHGMLSDIKSIAKECRKRDSLLLVDNAHGTHLKFLKNSLHPLDLGASMSADSAHKTLPVLTGGAWLHIKEQNLVDRAKEAMALFGSTSPSYPIMCTLDICTHYLMAQGKKDFSELVEKTKKIKNTAIEKGFIVSKGMCDPTRITFSARPIGYTGNALAQYLRANGVEPEFSDENYVVLIPSPFNSNEDWKRLEKSIINLKPKKTLNFSRQPDKITLPEAHMTIREAVFAKHKKVSLENSIGKVAGEIICPCPPGIPIVMPGEVIGNFEKELLILYGISEIHVVK